MFPFSKALRKDLEVAPTLADLARKRESHKLKQSQIIHEIISNLVFHTQGILFRFWDNYGVSSSHNFIEVCDADEL